MKDLLRKACMPLLSKFESGEGDYAYKPLNRKILLVMGVLFSLLGFGIAYLIISSGQFGYFLPALVFSCVGLVCIIIATLGNDRAVAKIWGSR